MIARRLTTHPGVGPLTTLAFELVIGTLEHFHCGKQIAGYVGLVPAEESSGDWRRLGQISKQGNVLLRFLLVEATQVTVRSQHEWRSRFLHLAMRRGRKIAKVAMTRKLAVHLCWMWRQGRDYGQFEKFGSHAGAGVTVTLMFSANSVSAGTTTAPKVRVDPAVPLNVDWERTIPISWAAAVSPAANIKIRTDTRKAKLFFIPIFSVLVHLTDQRSQASSIEDF